MAKYKSIIGRFEYMALPEQLLFDIPAKVDTGASISSIHAESIKEFESNGKKHLKFTVLENHTSCDYSREIEVANFSKKKIYNSFGDSESRYMVKLKVKLGNKTFKADFTLADRSKKAFPILLGRRMLNGRFVVDTAVNNIPKSFIEIRMPQVAKEDEV